MTRLKRLCKRCEKKFVPTGKFCNYCDNCLIKRKRWSQAKAQSTKARVTNG